MSSSSVTLGPANNAGQFTGQVTSLAGTNIDAYVSNGGGTSLDVLARLQVNPGPGSASGTVVVQQAHPSP